MGEVKSLDQIVKHGSQATEPTPAQQPAQKEPEASAPVVEAKESEPVAAKLAVEPDDDDDSPLDVGEDKRVPVAALQAERQKRKEATRLLAEERGKNQAFVSMQQRQPQAAAAPQPEVETPDEYYRNPAKYTQDMLQRALTPALISQKLEITEQFIRETKPDADEVLRGFSEMAQANPSYIQQMLNHPMPGKFAYETGKAYLQMKDVGSPEQLKEKLRKEVRAELEAEMRKQSVVNAAASVTPTNAGARGAGNTSGPVFSGKKSLMEILGR